MPTVSDSPRSARSVGLLSAVVVGLLASCGTTSTAESAARAAALQVDEELLNELPSLESGPVDVTRSLAAGKHVALVFWQPWCGACKHEVPALLAAQASHGSKLEVVGVVSGPDAVVDAFQLQTTVQELGITYPTTRDRELSLTRLLGVKATPTIVVLDPNRTVVFRGDHCPDWDSLLGGAGSL